MSFRKEPQGIGERVAAIEEALRRTQTNVAVLTTPPPVEPPPPPPPGATPSLVATPSHGHAGDAVVFSGAHYTPGATVTLTFDDAAHTAVTTTADTSGTISKSTTLPSGAVPGVYHVTATGGGTPAPVVTLTVDPSDGGGGGGGSLVVPSAFTTHTWANTGNSGFNHDVSIGFVDAAGLADAWFAAWQFGLVTPSGGTAGRMGLKTKALASPQKAAVFEIFGAIAATAGPTAGTVAETFTEGSLSGFRVTMPYAFVAGTNYRMRMWVGTDDASGTVWNCWIKPPTANDGDVNDKFIGSVKTPPGWGRLVDTTLAITSHDGGVANCTDVVPIRAVFQNPVRNGTGHFPLGDSRRSIPLTWWSTVPTGGDCGKPYATGENVYGNCYHEVGNPARPVIAVVNQSSRPDSAIAPIVAATQTQISRDLGGYWPIVVPTITFYGTSGTPPTGAWKVYVVDNFPTPDPGAAGYHETGGTSFGGPPDAYCLSDIGDLPRVIGHECDEMLINPAVGNFAHHVGYLYLMEVGDPVYQDTYTVDGVANFDDFVLPSFFGLTAGPPYDYLGIVSRPFSTAHGIAEAVRLSDGNYVTFSGGNDP